MQIRNRLLSALRIGLHEGMDLLSAAQCHIRDWEEVEGIGLCLLLRRMQINLMKTKLSCRIGRLGMAIQQMQREE